ncbi:leucine-rich repeat protein kinase family protein [Actinidia rufa]|uniref:Leucine-rich repeat protein kinase family protein n=1 Tax=Actinidia rufa TaxID=165716 RepID=A0A7J0F5C7_9ERIC|nr:leucine-rich repeat protein kinase family protein [Actinidia rufa]
MIGIASGCGILVLVLVGLGVYAFRQKKRAEIAIGLSKPFASWVPSGKDSGGAPQLKGARWFSYVELKKCTSHFSESNEIGSGGYGKVYRGLLPGGQLVAIKRAQQGSRQGGLEFKTEIELLSRLMDPTIRNMENLIGFGRFLELAMQCLEESAADRPTMSEVVKALETILQNDGLNTDSTSASSSATEFGSTKSAPPRHPYNDALPKKTVSDTTDAFDYSGGYTVPAKVEPK